MVAFKVCGRYLNMQVFKLVILGLLLNSANCSGESAKCDYPAIFNFGDSNSDTGGLSSAFRPVLKPNGETFFHKPVGRFCDGRVIIDFIAHSQGLPYISAYLQSIGSNFSHGANFATSGSTIREQNSTLSQSGFSPFYLEVQQWQFDQLKSKSLEAYKEGLSYKDMLPKPQYFSKGLYTFDIGQNDLTAALFLDMTVHQVRSQIPDMVNRFSNIIKNIYSGGGRNFFIHNTGPLGCLPYILVSLPHRPSQMDKNGCAIPYNKLAEAFNIALKKAVIKLRKDLPKAAITYVDMYSIKYNLIANGKQQGFRHPLRTCCGYGGLYNYNYKVGCGGKGMVNGEIVEVKSCKSPSHYLVWDGVHYTEAANHIFSSHVISGSFSDPPLPLSQTCLRKIRPNFVTFLYMPLS